ncbi:MAG: hypothetical protein GEU99_16985 [Luteitalea sp.]|nr:hypothetical protein [Luteitalea sp.]
MTKKLKGIRYYESQYRFASRFVHASDFAAHIKFNDQGALAIKLVPDASQIREAMSFARGWLWLAATRIDDRLGLGNAEQLGALKPLIGAAVKGETRP